MNEINKKIEELKKIIIEAENQNQKFRTEMDISISLIFDKLGSSNIFERNSSENEAVQQHEFNFPIRSIDEIEKLESELKINTQLRRQLVSKISDFINIYI